MLLVRGSDTWTYTPMEGEKYLVTFNVCNVACIDQIHNILISNKMQSNVYDVFYSHFSH